MCGDAIPIENILQRPITECLLHIYTCANDHAVFPKRYEIGCSHTDVRGQLRRDSAECPHKHTLRFAENDFRG